MCITKETGSGKGPMLYRAEPSHGGDVYSDAIRLDFSVSINPYGMPEGVRNAICAAAFRAAEYPDPSCRELVRAIGASENVPAEWILCGNGAAELIYSYCRALGGCMAVETAPAFSEYAMGMELAGGSMLRYPLKKEQDLQLDEAFLDFLQECSEQAGGRRTTQEQDVLAGRRTVQRQAVLAHRRGPGVVFLCNPNNPDGRNIPFSLLQRILAWCSEHAVRLFLDECFLDMSDHPDSMKPFLADHPELFLLRAFTKNYGMAGVRLGYGLCSDTELLASMSRMVQPWNVSVLAQAAGIAALREGDWILRARALIRTERGRLTEELKKMGFRVCASEANYLLFYGAAGLDRALRKKGIAIRNCGNYHNLGEGWYRIGLKLPEENDVLIQALRDESERGKQPGRDEAGSGTVTDKEQQWQKRS